MNILKKRTLIISVVIFTLIFGYIFHNTYVFKIIDLTKQANITNLNMPYLRYNFESVLVYRGIMGNRYILWEAVGTTIHKNSNSVGQFKIYDSYNLKYENPVSIRGFKSNVTLFGYMFSFFPIPKYVDKEKLVYKSGDSVVIGLWQIDEFRDEYLQDGVSNIEQPYEDVLKNIEYIPHILIPAHE